MELELAYDVVDRGEMADGTFVVQVVAVASVDMKAVLKKCHPSGLLVDILDENGLLDDMSSAEGFGFLDRPLVHWIHSYHDLDCWNQGYVWVEEAEILTWAERGMPLSEHCRTPLWPNSNPEKIAPDLIFLDVRRGSYRKFRGVLLKIAWK